MALNPGVWQLTVDTRRITIRYVDLWKPNPNSKWKWQRSGNFQRIRLGTEIPLRAGLRDVRMNIHGMPLPSEKLRQQTV